MICLIITVWELGRGVHSLLDSALGDWLKALSANRAPAPRPHDRVKVEQLAGWQKAAMP